MRDLAGFPSCDDEGVENEVSPRTKVEREVHQLGYMAVGAFDAYNIATVLLEEELDFYTISSDYRVVVRLERLASYWLHPVAAN